MAIGDQYFDKVVLAMRMDGTNGSTTFIDENGHTLTANGNAQISTAQSKFGGSSAYFDGNGDYLSVTSSDFTFGTEDFTIEFFAYFINGGHGGWYSRLVQLGANRVDGGLWLVTVGATDPAQIFLQGFSGGAYFDLIYVPASTISDNAWHHIALTRKGSTWSLWLDGGLYATGTNAYSVTQPTLRIGSNETGSESFYGYIDDLRITKGVARYTANFTPPMQAFPDYYAQLQGTVKDYSGNFCQRIVRAHRRSDGALIAETLSNPSTGEFTIGTQDGSKHYCVVHDDDAFYTYLPMNGSDGSTLFSERGGKTVSVFGNAQIKTAQYAPLTGNTSSAYFDGSGDYLTLPVSSDLDFGTSDFTVEFWYEPQNVSTGAHIVSKPGPSGINGGFLIAQKVSAPNKISILAGDDDTAAWEVDFTGTTALVTGNWYHVAVVRSGSSFKLFINGVVDGSATWSGKIGGSGTSMHIGAAFGGLASYVNGYIDDLRITKGKAQYLGNFTPPTVPHQFGQQNALIYDHLTPV